MSAWFFRGRAPKPTGEEKDKLQVPGGLWTRCPECGAITYTVELERAAKVCPKCSYHFRLSVRERIDLLCDQGSFEEFEVELTSSDPLSFKDSVKYKERLRKANKTTNELDAVKVGVARMGGHPIALAVMNFSFMGGSMGVVVGEKLTRLIERACQRGLPVVIVTASGGARMQEGIFSLMQMAKVSCALGRLSKQQLPYISVLTDPTTGGVAASFAMQGDIIIAEPKALIGFAGPRVIEQTIRRKLPEGFQRSEFLLEHGMVDMVVEREKLKTVLQTTLELLMHQQNAI